MSMRASVGDPERRRFRVAPAERFSSYSHTLCALAAAVGAVVLFFRAPDVGAARLAVLVYSFGAIAMFGASALYHAQKRAEQESGLWRRLDHAAVFVMIAGTNTPVCYAYLPSVWFWAVVGTLWALAVFGIAFKMSALGNRRWLTVGVYLAMGWMGIIPLPKMVDVMPLTQIFWLTLGGVIYSAGAIVYATKRPDPWPNAVGFHGVWHLFVIAAAVAHFILVYGSLVAA